MTRQKVMGVILKVKDALNKKSGLNQMYDLKYWKA